MHVFAQNEHCDEWNARRLALLPGTVSTSVASDGKKMTVHNLLMLICLNDHVKLVI